MPVISTPGHSEGKSALSDSTRTDDASTYPDGSLAAAIDGVRQDMLRAVEDADWEHLQALDRQARDLIERAFAQPDDALPPGSEAALRSSLEELAGFYQEVVEDLSGRRANTAEQLRELRSGRSGINAYESTRRHSMQTRPPDAPPDRER